MTAFKAQAHMRTLEEHLKEQVAGITFQDSQDSNANPISKMVAASETQFAKIETDPSQPRVDALGLTQRLYSPHVLTILRSSTVTSEAFRAQLLAQSAFLGLKVLVYQIASLPPNYDLTGATLVATIYPDAVNKLTDQQ